MDKKQILELIEKVKKGQATPEEKLAVLKTLNSTIEEFTVLLKEINQSTGENK